MGMMKITITHDDGKLGFDTSEGMTIGEIVGILELARLHLAYRVYQQWDGEAKKDEEVKLEL
jgi:hypothetical protein